ncbi:MAG: hypothetical protein KDL87_16455, partial [Verrucomicrobiae bacterium]|nr:hypothetical protein [Verrucomicrobiae bacterium]
DQSNVVFADGAENSTGALIFLGRFSIGTLTIPFSGRSPVERRIKLNPPDGWKMGVLMTRGFEVGFGDTKVEEESLVSKLGAGLSLQNAGGPHLVIRGWLKDLKGEKRWYLSAGCEVLWFGIGG